MGSVSQYNILLIAVFSLYFMVVVLSLEVVINDECSSSSKTTYVRYGQKKCPDSAELVYEGRVAGSKYNENGGGMNYLCLPLKPVYEAVVAGATSYRATIYGAEYAPAGSAPIDDYNSLNQHVVPCAVCLVRSHSMSLMIPARNDCPSSEWTKEYSGYLMAEWTTGDGRHRTEFVCVDKDMESPNENPASDWGSALFFTEAFCSDEGLPCGSGEYVDGNELTCAVCTI